MKNVKFLLIVVVLSFITLKGIANNFYSSDIWRDTIESPNLVG